MKKHLFRLYAGLVLIVFYLPMHIETQAREISRAFRNWKPKNTFSRSHAKWAAFWELNIRN